jgi:hypothetical protein
MCASINQHVLACRFNIHYLYLHFRASQDSKYLIYMGKDKYENEELIRYGLPEDIW